MTGLKLLKNNTNLKYLLVFNLPENITKTLFGVKILDILDCCATSDYHSLLSHSSRKFGFKINTEYELRDINVLEALPSIGLSYSTPEV